jgi:hypothetical protein
MKILKKKIREICPLRPQVTGTNILANGGALDIDVTKLTITGNGGATYPLTSASVNRDSNTQFTVTLNGVDRLAVAGLLNKDGKVLNIP